MAHARQEVEEMKNLPQVMATGVQGAAVIAAVAEAPDMVAATAELRRAWDSFLVERR
jgi:thiamine monophosphate synthase